MGRAIAPVNSCAAAGAAALGASQEAAAAADGGDDAAPKPALAKAGDVSRFAWLPGDDRQYDLVVTFGDATSAVYSALSSRRRARHRAFTLWPR